MIFNFLAKDDFDIGRIIDAIRPYVTAVVALLIAALVAFSVFKIIILAKDLAAAGDDPQRRSEIKKAFMYTLIAPIIGIAASGIIMIFVNVFQSGSGDILNH